MFSAEYDLVILGEAIQERPSRISGLEVLFDDSVVRHWGSRAGALNLFGEVLEVYRGKRSIVPVHSESALRFELANSSRLIAPPTGEKTIRSSSGPASSCSKRPLRPTLWCAVCAKS